MTEKEAFDYWCLWNCRKISQDAFNFAIPAVNPMEFGNIYWKKGLQEYWINFIKKRRHEFNVRK